MHGWRDLKSKSAALSVADNLQRHSTLTDAVADLFRLVGAKSGLRNESQAWSSYLPSPEAGGEAPVYGETE